LCYNVIKSINFKKKKNDYYKNSSYYLFYRCPSGFVPIGGTENQCQSCTNNCQTCTGTRGFCTSCLAGFFLQGSGVCASDCSLVGT
jgi:hypothetical protein